MPRSRERRDVAPLAAAGTSPGAGTVAAEDPELAAWRDRVDLEALLVALVLVPHSYPRNRFFDLYRWPAARNVRRRAALLRSVIADLASGEAEQVAADPQGEAFMLRYHLPEPGLHRTTRLSVDELTLVLLAQRRAGKGTGGAPPPSLQAVLATLEAAVNPEDLNRQIAKLERLFARGGAGVGAGS